MNRIMAAYWPFWNLFWLFFFFPHSGTLHLKSSNANPRFFFFWSGFVFGRRVWSLAAAKPHWFSDYGGLQRLLARQWRVFVSEILFSSPRYNVGVLFAWCISVHFSQLHVYFLHRRWLAMPPNIFHFFPLVFLRKEEKRSYGDEQRKVGQFLSFK